MFSATFPEVVTKKIDKLVKEASTISLAKEKLKLDHIKQFVLQCPSKKKADSVAEIYDTLVATQSIIFVNTRNFVVPLRNILAEKDCKASVMFGDMDNDERDEMMDRFRKGSVRTFITTNLLARGIDVPEIDIVINYDVPVTKKKNGQNKGDAETYLHRIGRAGRFGTQAVALTLLDREEDQKYFDEIVDHF